MKFKSPLWQPVAIIASALNLVAVGSAANAAEPWHAGIHAAIAVAFGLWAQRLGQRRVASAPGNVTGEMERQAAALEEAQATLANQGAQLNELQERVDFAERILAQVRERQALGQREEPPRP